MLALRDYERDGGDLSEEAEAGAVLEAETAHDIHDIAIAARALMR